MKRHRLTIAGEIILLSLALILIAALVCIIADNTPTVIRQAAGAVIALEALAAAILRLDKITAFCI